MHDRYIVSRVKIEIGRELSEETPAIFDRCLPDGSNMILTAPDFALLATLAHLLNEYEAQRVMMLGDLAVTAKAADIAALAWGGHYVLDANDHERMLIDGHAVSVAERYPEDVGDAFAFVFGALVDGGSMTAGRMFAETFDTLMFTIRKELETLQAIADGEPDTWAAVRLCEWLLGAAADPPSIQLAERATNGDDA